MLRRVRHTLNEELWKNPLYLVHSASLFIKCNKFRPAYNHGQTVRPDSKILLQTTLINLSKPTGHVMHQQFNIQQL